MSDTMPVPETPPTEQVHYEETIVEYRDNRRQRVILGVLLAVLVLLLLGVSYAVVRLTPGRGAPVGAASTPKGITWVRSIYGWGNGVEQSLRTPTDVAIAPNGTIWTLSNHDTVVGFNPDGSPYKVIKPKGVASLEGIAVGQDGGLYVADFGGQLVKFSPQGELLDKWQIELPSEVDVRDGKIAIAASKGIAIITEDQSKVVLQLGGTRGWAKDQFDLPHGIILAKDGTIYVSDTQNRRVKALDATGRIKWILGDAPDRSKPGVADVRSQQTTNAPFLIPSGMTLDGKGRVVVIDPFKFRIAIVDQNTGKVVHEGNDPKKRLAYYGDYGAQDGFFANPTGIAYDKTRDWFAVADTSNNRIQILRLPETGGSVLAPAIGAFRLPMCLFCIPWLLILAAIVYSVIRRRKQEPQEPDAEPGPEAA